MMDLSGISSHSPPDGPSSFFTVLFGLSPDAAKMPSRSREFEANGLRPLLACYASPVRNLDRIDSILSRRASSTIQPPFVTTSHGREVPVVADLECLVPTLPATFFIRAATPRRDVERRCGKPF
jgi:hypothetical protein